MDKLNELVIALTQNQNLEFTKECLHSILNEEIMCSFGPVLDKKSIQEQYSDHFKIQTTITKKEVVRGYQFLLDALDRIKQSEIRIVSVITESAVYIIFCEQNLQQIFGILKSFENNLSKMKKLNEMYRSRGFPTHSAIYIKKVKIDNTSNFE